MSSLPSLAKCLSNEGNKMTPQLHRRVKDFSLYIGISAAVITTVILVAEMGVSWAAFSKWGCFTIFTSVLFGYFVADSRKFWKRSSFWKMTGVLLLLHCLIAISVLAHMETVKPIWFCVMWFE